MKKLTLILMLSLSGVSVFATTTARLSVNGMVCAFCAQGIEKRLSQMKSTEAVLVDLKKKVVLVQAKPKQVLDEKAIAAEMVDAGYEVVKYELLQQSMADIKAEMSAKQP
jgi:copper chaperone CopZ